MAMKRLAVKKRSLLHRGCVNVFIEFWYCYNKSTETTLYNKEKQLPWCIPTVA